jgi:bla regulator protein blaR1
MVRLSILAAITLAGAGAGLAGPGLAQNRPATPAPAATPSSPPERGWPRSSGRDGYILSLGGQWLSSDVNFDEISESGALTRGGQRSADFLWFRRGGKAYLVDDAASLARAAALFEPLRALEPEQEALRERERALDDREKALDADEEDIDAALERLEPADSDEGDDDDEYASRPATPSAADEREREALERRMDEVRSKQSELRTDQRAYDRDERALDAREERLEKDAEAQLRKLMDELVASGAARRTS